ncbi:hypothetical protein LJK87_22395 [Paenibacillus sp. P25]|nr:hypothetical protein LJK87_22395 [Paenibacillus sp. P25]
MESGSRRELFAGPRHPYTIGLMKAVPSLDDPKDRRLVPIEGITPDLRNRTEICQFLPAALMRRRPARRSRLPGEGKSRAVRVILRPAIMILRWRRRLPG